MPCGKDTTDALHAERSPSSPLDGSIGSSTSVCQKDHPFVRDSLLSPLLTRDSKPPMHTCPRFISRDSSDNSVNSQALGHLMKHDQQKYYEHQLEQQEQLPSPATETHPSSLSAALPSNPHIIYPLSSAEHNDSNDPHRHLTRPNILPLVEHQCEASVMVRSHPSKREAGARELEPQEEGRRQQAEPTLDIGQENWQLRRCTSLKRRKLGEPSLKRPSLYNPSCPSSDSSPVASTPPTYSSQPQTTTTVNNTPLPTPPSDTAAYDGILPTYPMDAACHAEQHSRTDSNNGALSPVSPSAPTLTCVPLPLYECDDQQNDKNENGPQQQHDHNLRHCATQRTNSHPLRDGCLVTAATPAIDATVSSLNNDNSGSSNIPPISSLCVQNNADQKQERDQGISPLPLSPVIPLVHNSRNMGGGVDVMGVQGNEVLQQEQQQSNPDHNFHCMDLLALHSVTRQQQEDKQAAEAAEAAAAALVAASAAAVAAANASVFTHVGNTTEAQHTNITNQHTTPTTNSYTNTLFHPTRPFTMQQFRPWQFSAFPIKHPFVFHPPNEDSSSTAMTAKQKAVYPTMICPRKRSFEEAIEMAQPLREEEPSTLEHPGWLGAIKRRKIHHSATLWTSSLSPSPYVKLLAIRGFWDVMRSRVDLSWMESKFTARREFDDDEEEDGDESNEGAESDIYSDSQDHSDAFSSPSSGAEDSDEGTDSCEDEVDNALDRDWMNTPQNRWNKEKRTVDAKESKRRLGKMRESALSAGTNMTSATPNMTSVPRAIQRRKSHRRQRSRQAPATRDDGATTNHWDFRTSILSTSACNTCIRRVVLKHPNTVLLFRGLWAEEERNRRQRQQIPEGVHKPSRSKIINSRPLSRVHGPIHLSRTYGSTNEQQSNAHHQQQYSRRRTRNASVALDHTSEDSDDDEDDEVNDDDANSDDGTTPTTMREEQARQQHRQQQQDYEMELRRKHGLKTPLRNPSLMEASAGYDLSDYKPWKDGTISPQRGCIQTLDRLRTHLLEPWPKEEAKAKDECTRILHRMREQLNVVINLQIHLRSMMKSAPNQLSFLLSIRHPGQVSIELLQALYGPQFMDSSAFRTIEQLLWGSDGYHRRAGTSSAEASQPHAEEEDHALTSQQQQEQQEQHFHNHHHQQHINHHQQLEYHHPYEEYDQSGRDREACDTKQVEEDEEDENMSDDLSTEIHSSMEATVDSLGIH